MLFDDGEKKIIFTTYRYILPYIYIYIEFKFLLLKTLMRSKKNKNKNDLLPPL